MRDESGGLMQRALRGVGERQDRRNKPHAELAESAESYFLKDNILIANGILKDRGTGAYREDRRLREAGKRVL